MSVTPTKELRKDADLPTEGTGACWADIPLAGDGVPLIIQKKDNSAAVFYDNFLLTMFEEYVKINL